MEALIHDLANMADEIAASVETEIIIHAADRAKLRPIDSLDAWSAYHRAVRTMMQFKIEDAEAVDALLQRFAFDEFEDEEPDLT